MKKRLLGLLAGIMALSSVQAADYGIPNNIQDGNILHCFDWTFNDIIAELPNIAAAGFGSVQVSPVQGNCATNAEWYFAYMPYDFAFKANGNGSRAQLQSLCTEAAKYNIKIIVDVVANHVNQASGYHDTWWDSNGRVRWNGGINYGDRYSITHGQLGDYGDVNSESSEVQARAKAFVEDLKSLGVKGIRWDAAKHIALPSENCGFWSAVTSVSGLYHYGEILDNPGGNGDALMKEYTKYMSVTDNGYSKNCRDNDGVPSGYAGWAAGVIDDSKVVYWGESHDDYSNEWQASTHVSQAQIDRAWAIAACRNGATALYFSRPSGTSRNAIKMGQKGSTQFKQPQIAEVNKFRNLMVGKKDYYSQNGNVASVTRQNGGAVIVKKGGSGSVSVANGGGYCPAGTYKDRVSGGTFTVTSTTISGNVGSSGIAVIYNDGVTPNPNPDPTPDPTPSGSVNIAGDYNIAYSGDKVNIYYWGSTKPEWPGVAMSTATGSDGRTYKVAKLPAGTTNVIFNTNGDANKTGDLTYVAGYVFDDNGATSTTVTFNGSTPDPDPTPDPTPDPVDSNVYIYVDGWSNVHCYVYKDAGGEAAAWPGTAMTKDSATGYWKYQVPDSYATGSLVIINTGNGGSNRYPADMAPGMPLNGKSMIFHVANNGWEEYGSNPNPNPNPTPTPGDANMWILGNLATGGWAETPGTGFRMSQSGNVYSASGVEFALVGANTACYFNITDYLGATWDDLNMNANRYGAATEGEVINVGMSSTVVKYPVNVSASGCLSWTVAPGKYDVKFDMSAMNIVLTQYMGGVDSIEADYNAVPEYYNLQGVRVAEPTPGLYIVRRGNRVTKEIVK